MDDSAHICSKDLSSLSYFAFTSELVPSKILDEILSYAKLFTVN